MNAELQSLKKVQALSREDFLEHARRWYEDGRRQTSTPERKFVRFSYKDAFLDPLGAFWFLIGFVSVVLVTLYAVVLEPHLSGQRALLYMVVTTFCLKPVAALVVWRKENRLRRIWSEKDVKVDTTEDGELPPSDNELWFLYWTHQVQELREVAKQLLTGPATEIQADIDSACTNKSKLTELLRTSTDDELCNYLRDLQQQVEVKLTELNRERDRINGLRDRITSLAQSLESRVTSARSKYDVLAEVEHVTAWLGDVSGRAEERQSLLARIEFELVESCVRLANLVSSFEMLTRVDIAIAQDRDDESFEASMDRLDRVAEYPEIPESLFDGLDLKAVCEQDRQQFVLC